MQTVYIDVMVITNMFEDFLLLYAVKYILRLKAKSFRLILGSLTGGFFSLISVIKTPYLLGLLIKMLLAIILILIVFGFINRKTLIKASLTLIILSFLINGAIICFYLAMKPNGMIIINDSVYFDISPLLLIILTLIIYFILLLYKKMFKSHCKNGLLKTVEITYNNYTSIINCKIDSGMNVKEPFSGNSVIIAEKNSLGFDISENLCRVIPYNSLGGNGIIFGFKASKVCINGKTVNEEIYVGMCNGILKGEIQGLIPENITGE